MANKNFWKKGLPYMDAITLKTLPDEQARIAALRAGAIDGATVSSRQRRVAQERQRPRRAEGRHGGVPRAADDAEAGRDQAVDDVRVRQAVNFAINRQAIIDTVYGGSGTYSGHVPPGYGPWPLTQAELKAKYEKFDLPKAKALMAAAGMSKGFSVNLSTFSTPLDFQQVASVIKSQLKAINIDVNIVAQEPGTFAANNGVGKFEWDLTARGMRGDVDGYLAEYNPSAAIYKIWYPEFKDVKLWRDIGNGRITLDPAKRLPLYKDAQQRLMTGLPQIGLVQVQKYQVVRKRVQGMYVAFDDFNTGLRNTRVAQLVTVAVLVDREGCRSGAPSASALLGGQWAATSSDGSCSRSRR